MSFQIYTYGVDAAHTFYFLKPNLSFADRDLGFLDISSSLGDINFGSLNLNNDYQIKAQMYTFLAGISLLSYLPERGMRRLK
jgi:hypothetical protein